MKKLTVIFSLILFSSGFAGDVSAQTSPFPDPYVECSDVVGNEDFHSLRPFQASPCNLRSEDLTLYCGNDLIAVQHIGENGEFTPSNAIPGTCSTDSNGNQTCRFSYSGSLQTSIDLANAELPIVGNTELVPNSQNGIAPDEGLSDADRMNEYVSWYLNGTTYRAEEPRLTMDDNLLDRAETIANMLSSFGYGITAGEIVDIVTSDSNGREKLFSLVREYVDMNNESWNDWYDVFFVPDLSPESHTKLLAYSGPLNKLLPQRVQWDYKIAQIENVATTPAENDNPGARHNQIVGCTNGVNIPIPLIGSVTINIGGKAPVPCYRDSFLNIANFLTVRHRLSEWEGNLPPDENDPQYHRPFDDILQIVGLADNFTRYYTDYRRWRGEFCLAIPTPVIGSVVYCGPNPLNPNYHASLFPYLPYTSTEDRIGSVEANLDYTTQPSQDGVEIQSVSFTPDTDTTRYDLLYFAHMEESTQLAEILQKTFVSNQPDMQMGWSGENGPQDFYNTFRCDVDDSRFNPGDDLFGEYEGTTPEGSDMTSGTIDYEAEFECTFPAPDYSEEEMQQCHEFAERVTCSDRCNGSVDPTCFDTCMFEEDNNCRLEISGENIDENQYLNCRARGAADQTCVNESWSPSACEKDIQLALSLYVKAPKVNELYERTVSGEQSIFRRIYSQALIEQMDMRDIPGVIKGQYNADSTDVKAGVPSNNRPGSDAQLFIPHLGSVQEYFLRGIQKALRPQGYNSIEQISGTDPVNTTPIDPSTCKQPIWGGYQLGSWPSAINAVFQEAASKYNMPVCTLTAVASVEGSRMTLLTEEEARELTRAWSQEPEDEISQELLAKINCEPNTKGAAGPMQMKPAEFNAHAGASGSPNPSVCNARDAIFAAAEFLAEERLPIYGIDWSGGRTYCAAGETYYGTCNLDPPTCNNLGTNYCDFVLLHCQAAGSAPSGVQCSEFNGFEYADTP